MGYVSKTLAVVMLLKIFGASRQTVGGDHFICGVAAEEGVVVVGDILVGEFVVQQFCVQYATMRHEMAHAEVVVACHIVDVRHAAGGSYTTGHCKRQPIPPPHI